MTSTKGEPQEGRRAANAARKRSDVRWAALELSEEIGFSAVTMAAIADRSGVTERTIFRTFQSKAGIFWSDPLLLRIIERVNQSQAAQDPLAALTKAAKSAAMEMTSDELRYEARRRSLVLAEPELQGVGSTAVGRHIGALVEKMTPTDARPENRRRLSFFGLFAAMAVAFEPFDVDRPVQDWIDRIQSAITIAAHGPLPLET